MSMIAHCAQRRGLWSRHVSGSARAAWCLCYIRPHFRRAVLEKVGGWDPFNVTEDADLGLRLSRFGYWTATIANPTCEPGPERFDVWLRQRTRWFKGWMRPVNWHFFARDINGLVHI